MITKTVQRSDELFIQFTEEEMKALKIEPGDKFSYEIDNNAVVMKKFEKIDLDISEWSRDTLEFLIARSLEEDLPINDIICNILQEQINKLNV